MRKLAEMVGKPFGRWLVISFAGRRNGSTFWLCQCECGVSKEIDGSSLRRGYSKGCKSCSNRTHGQSPYGKQTAEYIAWRNMLARCYNAKYIGFKNYGGRGITVCDRWQESFESFFDDMGPKPSPLLTLERKENDGNYEPANCCWATRKEQANNRRKPNVPRRCN